MATIIEFYVPKSFRKKNAQRALEYGKLIEFRVGVESADDDSTASDNVLTLLLEQAALQIGGD
jgi:hypothetical protein